MTRKLPRKATDGAAIDGNFGARGNDPREHHLAREKAEEGEEDEARSPTRRRKTKTARSSGFARPTNFSGDGSPCALAVESRGKERANGEGKEARGSAHLLSERKGEKRGSWARGGTARRLKAERREGRERAAVGEEGRERGGGFHFFSFF